MLCAPNDNIFVSNFFPKLWLFLLILAYLRYLDASMTQWTVRQRNADVAEKRSHSTRPSSSVLLHATRFSTACLKCLEQTAGARTKKEKGKKENPAGSTDDEEELCVMGKCPETTAHFLKQT